jgi:DedD protein
MPNFTDDYTIYRMGLFSFLRKNKQETASREGEFYSRAEEESKTVRTRVRRKQDSKQDKDPVDPVLPEKKRARRRLVGAIALVLGVIIGLPMILDSEPKPLAGDVAIQIPSKDKTTPPARQPTPPAPPRAADALPVAATLGSKEEVVETAQAPSASARANANAAVPPVIGAVASHKPKEEAKPADVVKQSTPKPAAIEPDAKVATAPSVQKTEDAARAKAILEGKSDTKTGKSAVDSKPTKFMVQVAALASQGKINELQGKLKAAGIKSVTQKVATESGQRTRIRVGPFTNKEEADKMRAKLAKLGLNGTVVPIS